jgi:mRNA interferase YafQ
MLKLISENQFQKDLERARKRRNNMEKLKEITQLLVEEKPLFLKHRNHKLAGKFEGCWECHIEPDWLLIYEKTSTEIIFIRMGTHSDLF